MHGPPFLGVPCLRQHARSESDVCGPYSLFAACLGAGFGAGLGAGLANSGLVQGRFPPEWLLRRLIWTPAPTTKIAKSPSPNSHSATPYNLYDTSENSIARPQSDLAVAVSV